MNISHLYIHIPYCSKLCYYCDFHFSLNLKTRTELIASLCKEILLQKELFTQPIETLYFGGGTPSLLNKTELEEIFSTIHSVTNITEKAEISFECNPDDITEDYCKSLLSLGINRLSIGIQSFFDDDLQLLNRRHSAESARSAVKIAQNAGFKNITVDLIYGLPNMTLQRWQQNLNEVEKLNVQHLSAYSLMVEEHTALHKFVRTGKFILPNEDSVLEQFNYLIDWSQKSGFEQYEISNFAKNQMYSKHNSSYWTGEPYIGIGPSAHSFDGNNRYWNIAHNAKYIEAITKGNIPHEKEILSTRDKYNELIMIGLRTKKGVDIGLIKKLFPDEYYRNFVEQKEKFIQRELIIENQNTISLTRKGIMLSDSIMSDFFITE
ncbi:MAG: radical SAM family heme chaperone HemW [Bacteroidales bacterium]|nr:radical SAM family heme chaperone HemW [Bacteroidales bacterium]